MPKSPEEMAAAMIANMPEKTGKTLEQWLAIASKTGAEKHGQIVKALKADHGMTHGYANLVAHKLLKSDAGSKAESGEDILATPIAVHRMLGNLAFGGTLITTFRPAAN